MNPVEIAHIAKKFGSTQAVSDVSFDVFPGEIFGLLGPNGAGKTTTIRILLDLFKPDTGSVSILGGPMSESKKSRIGYLPEERGLYQDAPLEECLLFFAALKGMSKKEAKIRLTEYLERFDLLEHRKKKVKELSKGMQQKAQVISTVLHHPELILIDEPFSGLDPINTQMVRDLFSDLRKGGSTIIMSTHQMHLVEELCDRLALIHRGRDVLYGSVSEIRRNYATGEVRLSLSGPLPELPGVALATPENGGFRLSLQPGIAPVDLLVTLANMRAPVEKFEIAMPSLDEIFIKIVGENPDTLEAV